jgi:DNA end-binding protein Ku
MARSTSWKGYLKLSLVSCAVAMAPATSATEKIRFNNLNRKTGNRLRMRMIDAGTGEVVETEDQVRGYQTGRDHYIQVEEEDLEAIALESRHTIDIDQFVPVDQLDRLYMGDSHYLMPDDEVALEAFSVIREAMARSKVAGIARLTMNDRERWVAVQPRGQGILLTTMKYPYEVRSQDQAFARIDDDKPDPKAVAVMEEVIDLMAAEWNPKEFKDRYQEALQQLLKEKQKGHKVQPLRVGGPKVSSGTRAGSLIDALRKSIAAEKQEGKKPRAASKTRSSKGKSRAA